MAKDMAKDANDADGATPKKEAKAGEAKAGETRIGDTAFLGKPRAEVDAACDLLAEAHQKLNSLCNEFEALLDNPDQTLSAVRKVQAEARAAGMMSMGLATRYLAALNNYMKQVEEKQADSA